MFLQVTFFLTQSKNFESKFYFDKEFKILPILKEDSMIHLTVPIAHESLKKCNQPEIEPSHEIMVLFVPCKPILQKTYVIVQKKHVIWMWDKVGIR